jgi:hypothetical protein
MPTKTSAQEAPLYKGRAMHTSPLTSPRWYSGLGKSKQLLGGFLVPGHVFLRGGLGGCWGPLLASLGVMGVYGRCVLAGEGRWDQTTTRRLPGRRSRPRCQIQGLFCSPWVLLHAG